MSETERELHDAAHSHGCTLDGVEHYLTKPADPGEIERLLVAV